MQLSENIDLLPLTKTKKSTLVSLFGKADMIPMWVADMDFEIAEPIQKALTERIIKSSFGYEYKPASFFKAQEEWYQRKYQVALDPQEILYSPSITTSISIIIEQYTKEQDGIIIQPPVFMEFRDVIRKANRRIVKNPLRLLNSNGYEIDFDHLESVAQLESNKVLVLCNPHNPVGRVWDKKDLEKIISICKQHDLLLIADEIHKDIILFGHQFTSVLQYKKQWDKIIICTSEAKTFNLCGISDSMLIIPDEVIRSSIHSIFKKYNLGRTNALTRVTWEAGYKEGEAWLKEVIKTIEKNVTIIEKELEGSLIKLIRPEGTYQVWLDFRAIYKDTKKMFRHVTDYSGVGMNAGHWFGREGALFMRMNIASSEEKVRDAIRRVVQAATEIER